MGSFTFRFSGDGQIRKSRFLGLHSEPIARLPLECASRSYELKMRHVPYDDSALFQQFESRDVPDRLMAYKSSHNLINFKD